MPTLYVELKKETVIRNMNRYRRTISPGIWRKDIDHSWFDKATGKNPLHSLPTVTSYMAERIWMEDDKGKVTWAKNRHGPETKVDMEEFFWIKLKAKQL